jgi:hypothetical protein
MSYEAGELIRDAFIDTNRSLHILNSFPTLTSLNITSGLYGAFKSLVSLLINSNNAKNSNIMNPSIRKRRSLSVLFINMILIN